MDLAHFRMLIHELLNNYPDIVTEEYPLMILDIKSSAYMDKNSKDTKHISHIARRVHFVRNGENYKMQKIDWWEVGLQLEDIANNNSGDNDLNPRMKYIVVIIENWYIILVQEGW